MDFSNQQSINIEYCCVSTKGCTNKSQNAPPINVKRPRTTLVARRRTNIFGYAPDSFPTTQVITITSFRVMEGLYNVGEHPSMRGEIASERRV